MVAHGRVRNGVVVLDASIRLTEGQEVTLLIPGTLSEPESRERSDHEPQGSAREVAGVKPLPIGGSPVHSILGILPVSLGAVLRPLASDDLLGEMLEDRL